MDAPWTAPGLCSTPRRRSVPTAHPRARPCSPGRGSADRPFLPVHPPSPPNLTLKNTRTEASAWVDTLAGPWMTVRQLPDIFGSDGSSLEGDWRETNMVGPPYGEIPCGSLFIPYSLQSPHHLALSRATGGSKDGRQMKEAPGGPAPLHFRAERSYFALFSLRMLAKSHSSRIAATTAKYQISPPGKGIFSDPTGMYDIW